MPTSVSSLVRNQGSGYMNFIDYTGTYRDNNKEFLRGDMWELQFTSTPNVTYFPGNTIMNARLNSVQVSVDSSVNGFEKRMRGNYVIRQQTGQNTSGNLSLSFVDREDQAISYFVDDWKQKISDRDTKYSFRKDDLVCDLKLTLLNSSRVPVRELIFYNAIIQDAPLDENGADSDGTDRADVQLNLAFEHYERNFLNLQ